MLVLGADVGGFASEPDQSTRAWTFDTESPNALSKGFVIGTFFDGRPAGEWKVLTTDRAKSAPQVLAQLMGKGSEHAYKVVLLEGLALRKCRCSGVVLAHCRECRYGRRCALARGR